MILIRLEACGTCPSEVTLTKLHLHSEQVTSTTDPATPSHPILFILKPFK